MGKPIVICGFMGSGKTTVGRLLAKRLLDKFIDLDEEIEQTQKMSIPNIFKEKGEEYFQMCIRDSRTAGGRISRRGRRAAAAGFAAAFGAEAGRPGTAHRRAVPAAAIVCLNKLRGGRKAILPPRNISAVVFPFYFLASGGPVMRIDVYKRQTYIGTLFGGFSAIQISCLAAGICICLLYTADQRRHQHDEHTGCGHRPPEDRLVGDEEGGGHREGAGAQPRDGGGEQKLVPAGDKDQYPDRDQPCLLYTSRCV